MDSNSSTWGPWQLSLVICAVVSKIVLIYFLVSFIFLHPETKSAENKLNDFAALSSIRSHFSLGNLIQNSWKEQEHPCSWHGVTCNAEKTRVIELNCTKIDDLRRLPGIPLRSSLPDSLSLLAHLKVLDVSNCDLRDSLPKMPKTLEKLPLYLLIFLLALSLGLGNYFSPCAHFETEPRLIPTCDVDFVAWSEAPCDQVWESSLSICFTQQRDVTKRDEDAIYEFMGPNVTNDPTADVPSPGTTPEPMTPVFTPTPSPTTPTPSPTTQPFGNPAGPPGFVPQPAQPTSPSATTPYAGPAPSSSPHGTGAPSPNTPPTDTPVPNSPSPTPNPASPHANPPSTTPDPLPPANKPPTPSTPVATPIDSPSDLPCGPPPTPNIGFYCDNSTNRWTIDGNVDEGTLTLFSPTVVEGNVSTTTLVFEGDDSFITVRGCLNAQEIEVKLTKEQLEKLRDKPEERERLLLQTKGNLCSSLETVPVKVTSAKSCIKASSTSRTQTQTTGERSLSAVFSIGTIRCKLWWIILISVLGGILLIVIAVVLLSKYNKSFKKIIRPFSQRKNAALRDTT